MTTNEELSQAFRELDQDGDGHITAPEFAEAMTARGEEVTEQELKSIFADADRDSDGKISLAEFTDAWLRAEQ